MYLYLLILLQLLSSAGASESGIVGGKIAKPHSRPYMVSLQHRRRHVCGGMLIREDFVLTSAHCLKGSYPLTVVLGAHDLTEKEKKSRQEMKVSHYHRHPLHQNITQLSYDIMLLKLHTNATLNKYVKVIGLPDKDKRIPARTKCSVAGWGKTKPDITSGAADVLMEVEVTMQFNFECVNKLKDSFISSQMICTEDGQKDFCEGDSGGPVICKHKNVAQGIVAFFGNHLKCDDRKFPRVYMNISFFKSWIEEVIHGYTFTLRVLLLGQTFTLRVLLLGQTFTPKVLLLGQTFTLRVLLLGQTFTLRVLLLGQTFTPKVLLLGQTFTLSVLLLGQTFTLRVLLLGQTFTHRVLLLGQTFTLRVLLLGQTFTLRVLLLGQNFTLRILLLGQTFTLRVLLLGQTFTLRVLLLGQTFTPEAGLAACQALSNHLDLCQSTTMYLYLLILLQLLSSAGASESGIVGGKIVKPHSRTYMVSLQHRGYHVCGGMLIRKDFVLTSAHCLRNAYPLTVVLGAHDLKKWTKSCQKIQVSHYHRHPLHENATQNSYDIMLLKLKTTARLTQYVTVVGLPKEDEHIPASPKCSVAGWGKTNSNNKQGSDVLMAVAVMVEDNSECKTVWQKYFDINQMMCTRTTGGKGFCQGDSGGPLICNNKAQGIVAFNYAERCDDSQYPHVYMKIPFFMPWIKEVLHGYGANMSLNKQE
ncbi:uncharacterized protein [Salvelinus alpinus]|uniref:uncharacterized protein n=2 Tax=Salvelinus TaxID=8033 RepID=UPI0039FBD7C5